MKLNDFLIKATTGYVFQVVKIENNIVEYSKLGDSGTIKIEISMLSKEFSHVPFLSNEGKQIIKLRQTLSAEYRDQFIVYDKNEECFVIASSFDLDDNIYKELKSNLDNLNRNSSKTSSMNETLRDSIRSFKGDGPPKTVNIKNTIEKNKQVDFGKDKTEKDSEELKFNIIEPSPSDTMENIILADLTKEKLEAALIKYNYGSFINKYLENDSAKSNEGALILNLYGAPGTGKTISAKAFANKIGKKILSVDFAQLISKMVGDTGKNIQKYFEKAKEDGHILLFDEADTLIQKRASGGDTHAYYINQNQNIFMREIDNFNGIVILTTNLFGNYDEALLRRIESIEYPLPTKEMRELIISKHLSKNAKYEILANPFNIAESTEGFSGGDIKNLTKDVGIKHMRTIINYNQGRPQKEIEDIIERTPITLDLFLEEIKNIKNNKDNYSNIKNNEQKNKKPIGLNNSMFEEQSSPKVKAV